MEVFFFRVINFARCTPISNCHDCSGRGELKIGDVLNHSGAPNDDLPLVASKVFKSTFRSVEMHSKACYEIYICSVILG